MQLELPSQLTPSAYVEYLWRTSGLSRKKLRLLLEKLKFSTGSFSNPEESQKAWARALRHSFEPKLAELFEKVPSKAPHPFLSYGDLEFPESFTHLHDPPLILYHQGHLKTLKHPGVFLGIVGTRRASAYAREMTSRLVKEAQAYDPVIVSGMAAGLDSAAHEAALNCGLKSVGILGLPLSQPYGASDSLYEAMKDQGLLLSELYPEAPLGPWVFPERNRLIAALSEAIIVVEAPEKSGALITAKQALDLGKDIYVLPGPYYPSRNQGGHRLIQEGAYLLTSVAEIFENLGFVRKNTSSQSDKGQGPLKFENFSPREQAVLRVLSRSRAPIDKIVSLSQLATSEVSALVMDLSLKGVLQELPGGLYGICPQLIIES